MNHATEIMDWVARILALGSTGIGAWFIRQKLSKNGKRSEKAAADVDEYTVIDRIRTSSVAAAEAQLVAADRAFSIERDSLNRTITFLKNDNADLHAQVESKDARLRDALAKIDQLQAQLTELAEQVRADIQDIQETPHS